MQLIETSRKTDYLLKYGHNYCKVHGNVNLCYKALSSIVLCLSSSKSRASRASLALFFSVDFHDLWHSMMSTCVITEVQQQWTTFELGLVTI